MTNPLIDQARPKNAPGSWETTVEPLEAALTKLSRGWGAVGHLMGVMDSPEWREAFNANLPRVAQFYITLSQNESLFARYKEIEAGASFSSLDPLKQRVVAHEIRDFRLSGAELAPEPKARLKALEEESSQLSQKFSENLLDATNAFTLDVTDEAELDGIPEDIREMYAHEAKAAGVEGWRITLQIPSYLPAMQYANNRALREKLYRAYSTRASDLDKPERDNTPVIARLLTIRHEEAALLGMKDYAEVSLATKMAKDPQRVIDFLESLAKRAKPKAEADFAELAAYAAEKLGIDKLEPWDTTWASEKLRRAKYNYSGQEVRRYFTLPAVFSGMFRMVENLFDIRITPDTAPVWHPDVQFWRISDKSGNLIAQFYTDLYARASKRGGAWMDECMSRRYRADGSLQLPVTYLVCNFTPPVNGKQSELTHDEVVTLFHEFGHGLNQLLTRIDIADVSGINGVPWDAVELPSQFNENFAWQEEVLNFLSCHVRTGEHLPKEKLDALIAAKNFESAMAMLRQLEFAIFDFRIHAEYDPHKGGRIYEILNEVKSKVSVVPQYENGRFPNGFSHIFAGGYAAGYYSYKWAEVLAADAFGRFIEEGIFNKEAGADFRDYILASGGAEDPMKSFIAFRGRKPKVDALLVQSGIKVTQQQ